MKIDRGFYKYGRLQKDTHNRPPGSRPGARPAYEEAFMDGVRPDMPPEDRERLYPVLARAERALCLQIEARGYEESDSTALRLNNLGLSQMNTGDLQEAFRSFRDAIDQDPGLALPYNNIGLLYLEIGDPGRAIDYLQKATAIQEDLDIAHGNMGLAYLELGYEQSQEPHHYELSLERLMRALDIDSGEPMHHNNLGILLLELDRPQYARTCFERAIEAADERNQENPMYYRNRGIAHEAAGNHEDASQDFLTALRLTERQMEANTWPA